MQDNEWIYMENLEAENNQLKSQLARLDDVEGLADIINNIDDSKIWTETEDGYVFDHKELAQAVINYIKGE